MRPHTTRSALLAVVAFGVLMMLIALFLASVRHHSGIDADYRPSRTDALFGVWDSRTLSDDNSNGAYTGQIEFGPDFYWVRNDLVHTPIRIDRVHYELVDGQIQLRVIDSSNAPIRVTLHSPDRATIRFGNSSTVLYMDRR